MEEFIDLLKFNGVERILDVRLLPGSRRYPHFNADALREFLAEAGIDYHHIAGLGGRRKASPDSKNLGWKNASFRGYADYMATEGFNRALNEAVALATERPSALLCAEAVPWRCHRSLIGDALLTRGWEVLDILGPGAAKPHRLTAFAKVEGEKILYPAVVPAQKSLSFEKAPD